MRSVVRHRDHHAVSFLANITCSLINQKSIKLKCKLLKLNSKLLHFNKVTNFFTEKNRLKIKIKNSRIQRKGLRCYDTEGPIDVEMQVKKEDVFSRILRVEFQHEC